MQCLRILVAAALLSSGSGLPMSAASAQERLLRCVTSPAWAQPWRVQHVTRRRLYAPMHDAMFFSKAGSMCRWKAPHRRLS